MSEVVNQSKPYRILSLDGGGAKGFYTLGVLREVEALLGAPLCDHFDLIFGTSTGSIIGALLARGDQVEEVHDLYREYVPTIMRKRSAAEKSAALAALGDRVFGDLSFAEFRTSLGIVATRWQQERPMIFKTGRALAHGRSSSFVAGFGVSVSDAVQASCSAYPFFKPKLVRTGSGDEVLLVDGGFCANNPTLYAIADAVNALGLERGSLRVLSVGVGIYPAKARSLMRPMSLLSYLPSVQLLQKVLEINTQSMEQLRVVLYSDVPTVRVNDTFSQPELATDLTESNLGKLNLLRQQGADSFARQEAAIASLLKE